jgi:rfaE bifunctional protein kinase chain/domain
MDDLITRLATSSVLVVGDVMLDELVWGSGNGTTSEGELPVVAVERVEATLGGAGNTAANAAGLGARTHLVGVVGVDRAADRLRARCDTAGIDEHLVAAPERATTRKTRLCRDGLPLLRIDREVATPVDGSVAAAVVGRSLDLLDAVDAVVVSDYRKGTVLAAIAQRLVAEARARDLVVVVDTKAPAPDAFAGCSLITPNGRELEAWTGRTVPRDDREAEVGRLRDRLGGALVLVTDGPDGMTLYGPEGAHHVPAGVAEVRDATGAGDTTAATFALALAAGATPVESTALAGRAAAAVVQRDGVATVTVADLDPT